MFLGGSLCVWARMHSRQSAEGMFWEKKVSYCFERVIGSQALFLSQQTSWGYDSFAYCWQSSHRHRRASLGMKLTLWMVDGKTERPQVLDDMLSHWIKWTWNTHPTPSTTLALILVIRLLSLSLCNLMDCSLPGSSVLHYLLDLLKLTSIELVMLSNRLILCRFLLLLL